MGLMGIGEFARLSRLSPKALRLYDELGLLPPARVDPDSGYRWYARGQVDQARLVASLRQIGVPLAQIKVVLGLDAPAAAGQVDAWWTGAEAQHAARRELAGYLVDRLNGKRPVMYEIAVRDIPARSLLTLLRHVHPDEQIPVGREFLIGRMRKGAVPSPEGIAGAPFMIFHAEVTEDSDGPVEWCWPVPGDQAAAIAARFPDLTLRTEPAHQEAFIHLGQRQLADAEGEAAVDALYRWTLEQHRTPNGGPRMILIGLPSAGDPGVLRSVIGSGLFLAVCALFAFGIAALLRNTAGAISAAMGLLFVPPLLVTALPTNLSQEISRWLPSQAGSDLLDPITQAHQFTAWTGFGLFCVYTAILAGAGLMVFNQRDS